MNQQKIFELNGFGYSARINLTRGGNCISLRNQNYGATVFREPDYSQELDNPFLYGMPILFPVNRISGGEFEFEGRTYRFPINEEKTGCHLHGSLHEAEFELLEAGESSLTCAYRADKQHPYLDFPHEFEIMIEYKIKSDGFYHRTKVINHSENNMPVMLGFHSTFNALFAEKSQPQNIKVYVDISEEYERNMKNYLPTGVKPDPDSVSRSLMAGDFNPFCGPTSRHYRSGTSGKMVLYDAGNDLSVVYENDEKYGFRLVYNGNGDEYICLEPQNCLANCPNAPVGRAEAGFDYIKPGEFKLYTSRIYISEGDHRG